MTDELISTLLFAIRVLLPFIALVIVYQVFSSMRSQRRGDRALIMLENELTKEKIPIIFWENAIGRSRRSDVRLSRDMAVSRDHAVLFRREEGWMISDTESKAGVYLNGKKIKSAKKIRIDDVIRIGDTELKVLKANHEVKSKKSWFFNAKKSARAIRPGALLFLVSFFHLLIATSLAFKDKSLSTVNIIPFILYGVFTFICWFFYVMTRVAFRRTSFELETLGLFLSGTGVLLIASDYKKMYMQLLTMCLGLILFCCMISFLKNVERVAKFRLAIAIVAVGLFAVNLVFGKTVNGSKNWISFGPVQLQLSEFVKIAFVFVGTSTLERLQTTRNLTGFILFSAMCIGSLFLMRDFGTACIFFVTFIIISFFRSGSFRTAILSCSVAGLAAFMILKFKPYVAERFKSWGHVWADPQDKGYQQVQVLICSASGGLFGVGIGCGHIKKIFAGTSDLMYGLISEELGILMGIIFVFSIVLLAMYACTVSSLSRSTFYSIAACSAGGMLVFQTALHVLGITDIIPLTGVTLPFLSAGGSSMICVWGLLAFIKAADERTYLTSGG